jgi:cyclophilin family peptidyl-prolyl cis-trans isomerase
MMKAYITINHGDTSLGTLRLTLRPDVVPRTVQNFVHFLTTNRAIAADVGYRNSSFHRVIPKFMAQGGDIINHDGTGSTSIFGGKSFNDENFILSHSQRGTMSMANSGVNTNGCQFFITFGPTAHLDGIHVVFGYVDWRDDDESADVLEKLEKVRTDRRNDRPLEEVRIVDCGIVGKSNNLEGVGGLKLVGEAKMNKLMQAYGQVDPANATSVMADDDEIDLDDEDGDNEDRRRVNEDQNDDKIPSSNIATGDGMRNNENIDIDDETDEPIADNTEATINESGKLTKKAALQKRLAALRTKINQSRTLNRREVHAEATRLGTDEAISQERKRQNKQDRTARQKEYDTYVVGKLRDVTVDDDKMQGKRSDKSSNDGKAEQKKLASLFQPAYDSIREMNVHAEKLERSKHGPDDYYNPEGQYTNYERNLNSIRHSVPKRGDVTTSSVPGMLDSYDPTSIGYPDFNTNKQSLLSEKDGARRLATEMKRRAEKKANQKRKLEFDAVDVTSINDRNKRFNEKIGRNFDKHTAEIKQNLERGTAL